MGKREEKCMKLLILIAYFIVLITIGFVCRQKATDVNGFVLGGRSVGPWLTAFAYGTSARPIFPPWSLWAMPDSSAGVSELLLHGPVSVMLL